MLCYACNRLKLENKDLSVCVLPRRGGKIASIFDKKKNFELLYQPGREYPSLYYGMPFSHGDASGFDDVFPSMGEIYSGPLSDNPLILPDHGEIWTSVMSVENMSASSVRMSTQGQILPYDYSREIWLDGRNVRLQIRIRNTGTKSLPLVWVCHCLMRLEKDTIFEYPLGSRRIECIGGCTWPGTKPLYTEVDDPVWAFSSPPPENHMMKFYFRDPVISGCCAVCYPESGMKAMMTFNPDVLPWLGFWITTGGYRKEHNFAFEPSTAYYDTWERAERNGRLPKLEVDEEACLNLSVSLRPWEN